MSAHGIASKVRRALRNETGVALTLDQLRELVREDNLLNSLSEREANELCPATTPRSSSETIGSISAGMGGRSSGRSRPTQRPRGAMSIAALSEGM